MPVIVPSTPSILSVSVSVSVTVVPIVVPSTAASTDARPLFHLQKPFFVFVPFSVSPLLLAPVVLVLVVVVSNATHVQRHANKALDARTFCRGSLEASSWTVTCDLCLLLPILSPSEAGRGCGKIGVYRCL
jgi:hypothetical protein